ncbi:MAG: N-acetylmuramoyl-L-alanine amidase family protein [Balneolaceae bacterium]
MTRQILLLTGLLVCIWSLLTPELHAQETLSRISAVERSDGNGFVIRYHLSSMIDSSDVYQPRENLIQMMLYAPMHDTLNFRKLESNAAIRDLDLYNIPSGFAVDIHLQEGIYFNTRVYPDQNGTDLLLALSYTPQDAISGLLPDMDPIDWSLFAGGSVDPDPTVFDEIPVPSRGSTLRTVVLDAGHGGRDPGSIGVGGIREKDLALEITLRVGQYLKENIPDLNVVYTRTDDRYISLPDRGRIANEHNGDLFVSIHANSFSRANASGAEVYFLGMTHSNSALEVIKRENSVVRFDDVTEQRTITDEDMLIYELENSGNMRISERLAEKIENQFRVRAQRRSRGVKQGPFQVLYEASMPSVLIELGFLSNPSEARYMTSDYGQAILASAIFRSIRDFKVEYDRSFNRNGNGTSTLGSTQ